MPSRRILLKIPCGSSRSVRPQRPIWRTAYGSALSFPNSLCALIRFDFRLDGLSRRTNQRFANYRTSPKRVNTGNASKPIRYAQRICLRHHRGPKGRIRMRGSGAHELKMTKRLSFCHLPRAAEREFGWAYPLGLLIHRHVTHMGGWYNVFASEAMPLAFLNLSSNIKEIAHFGYFRDNETSSIKANHSHS